MTEQDNEICVDPQYVMPDGDAKILWGIIGSETFRECVEDIPDDWILEIVGPLHGSAPESAYAATVMPQTVPENHRLHRIRLRGLMKGHGSDRLEAMKRAARFALDCTRQGLDQAVFGMTEDQLKDLLSKGPETPYERAKAWIDEACDDAVVRPERARQTLNCAKYVVSWHLSRRDAEGRLDPYSMDLMSGLSDMQFMIEHGSPDSAVEHRAEAQRLMLDLHNEKERQPQDR